MVGILRFYYGLMGSGKSTLALQIHHNNQARGAKGVLVTVNDRSGVSQITSRIGVSQEALSVREGESLRHVCTGDYLVVDESQFLTGDQIDDLAAIADDGSDVYCFGLHTDFRGRLFEGSRRLFEIADELHVIQVPTPCWCGASGAFNARVEAGHVAREGETVVVGDIEDVSRTRYQVLCRIHYREGVTG